MCRSSAAGRMPPRTAQSKGGHSMQAARGLGGASVWAGDGARNGRARGQGETRGCGARVERTTNMASMVVTLDVLLKFSGWLNADASCPAKGRAYEVGSTRAGRRERVGRCRCEERVGEGPKGDQVVRGTGRAHSKHGRHGGDPRRVEAQRLVECIRLLPSGKGRAYEAGDTQAGRRVRVGRRRCKERGGRASKGRPEGAGHGPSAPETCPPWW